jgi:hypothetical protein
LGGDTKGHILDDSADVSRGDISGVKWTSFQEGIIGKVAFIACRNSWSNKEKEQEQKSATVLEVPGTYIGLRDNGASRAICAIHRRRCTVGLVEEVEPF